MPSLPGETLLFNIFADVHYYFSQPSSKPLHHRFDKGSYLYLYYNSTQRRTRVEIANSAGTPEQDAVNGYLDSATLANSFKHPNLFSITVDGAKADTTAPRTADHSQWHLPAFDLKHEQKYLYKIHTLDLYLWTSNDSMRFLDSIKRVMPFQQLNLIEAAPPPEHEGNMSPVVQQLEHMAIHTPPHARAPSIVSNQSRHGRTPENQRAASYSGVPVQTPAQAPVMAAYNPAAPTAPEPIAHREKTPPPVDAGSGTGLSAAAVHEHPAQFASPGPQFSQVPQQNAFPGPPQRSTSLGSFPPPPPLSGQTPHHGMQTIPSFAPPPAPSQVSSQQQQPQTQYASYPQQQSAHYPQSPGFSVHTPLQSPGVPSTPGHPPAYSQHTPLQSPTFVPHTPLQSPGLPPPPSGGFSNYTYAQQPSQQQAAQPEAFGIHGQTYRPTEAEAAHGHVPKAQQAGMKPGGFEERLKKTEKGVGRFLRKLDQKM